MHEFFMIDEKKLEGDFQKLLQREINSPEDLKKWLVDESNLYADVYEKAAEIILLLIAIMIIKK